MRAPETVGFAILGAGVVADYHRRAIAANADLGARLVAVGHHDPDRFDEISAEFGVPCIGLDDLLARENVDVVCVCTPSGQHATQAIKSARAGKHVLVEKPMALTLEDADAMIEACDEANVKLGVVLQRRAESVFRKIREAIAAGDFGNITLGLVTVPYYRSQAYYEGATWRGTWNLDGGGVLMSQGIHLVDLLVWYMGNPVEVQAYASTLDREIEVEDTLTATLRFEGGALATITSTTTAAPGFPHRVEIYGTGGGVQVEGETVLRWDLANHARATVEPPKVGLAVDTGAAGDPQGLPLAGHVAVYQDFVNALRTNRTSRIDGVEGRRSLAAVHAVYRAAGLPSISASVYDAD